MASSQPYVPDRVLLVVTCIYLPQFTFQKEVLIGLRRTFGGHLLQWVAGKSDTVQVYLLLMVLP